MRATNAILVSLLVLGCIAALAATPIASGWSLRPFACDLGNSPDWVATIVNLRHLVSFGILAALAFLAFRDRPIWLPIVLLVLVTGAVELEEGLFASGHCRLRDMIPDMIAIAIGWAVAFAILRLPERRSART